jgi:IS30 family transposase
VTQRAPSSLKCAGNEDGTAVRRFRSRRDALITTFETLPPPLKRSLTWDQGAEMAAHHGFSIATNIPVYFCDPGSPWQ